MDRQDKWMFSLTHSPHCSSLKWRPWRLVEHFLCSKTTYWSCRALKWLLTHAHDVCAYTNKQKCKNSGNTLPPTDVGENMLLFHCQLGLRLTAELLPEAGLPEAEGCSPAANVWASPEHSSLIGKFWFCHKRIAIKQEENKTWLNCVSYDTNSKELLFLKERKNQKSLERTWCIGCHNFSLFFYGPLAVLLWVVERRNIWAISCYMPIFIWIIWHI